jgi:hypothetical protein
MQHLIFQSICLVIMAGCFLYYFKLVKDQDEIIKVKNAIIASQMEELKELSSHNMEMFLVLSGMEKRYQIEEVDGEYTITEELPDFYNISQSPNP